MSSSYVLTAMCIKFGVWKGEKYAVRVGSAGGKKGIFSLQDYYKIKHGS